EAMAETGRPLSFHGRASAVAVGAADAQTPRGRVGAAAAARRRATRRRSAPADERWSVRRRRPRPRRTGRGWTSRRIDRAVRIRRAPARARGCVHTLTLGIVYHMPFWRAPDGTLREVEGSFARYVDALAAYFDEVSLCVPVLDAARGEGTAIRS